MKVIIINAATRALPINIPVKMGVLYSVYEMLGEQVGLGDLDAHRDSSSAEAIRADLKSAEWDIAHVSANYNQFRELKRILPIVKKQLPKAVVAASGEMAETMPSKLMELIPEVDLCLRGNVERSVPELIDAAEYNRWDKVSGSVYREGGELVMSDRPYWEYDAIGVNDLPFPAYQYLPLDIYFQLSMQPFCTESINSRRRLSFMWERGRIMPLPSRAIENVAYCAMRHRIDFANFLDKNFMKNEGWLNSFLEEYEEKELNEVVPWSCVGDLDALDEKLIRNLRDAGCKYVEIEVEDFKKTQAAIDGLSHMGIGVRLTATVGKEEEVYENYIELTNFLKKIKFEAAVNIYRKIPQDDDGDFSPRPELARLERYLIDYDSPNPRNQFTRYTFDQLLAIQRLIQGKELTKLLAMSHIHGEIHAEKWNKDCEAPYHERPVGT